MINKIIISLLLLSFAQLSSGQMVAPQAINTAGFSSTNNNILLESVIGGLLVNTISTNTFIYTQDFLQPDAGTTNEVPYINDIVLSQMTTDNAGTSFAGGDFILEFSVGEFVTRTLTNTNIVTQGLLQPEYMGPCLLTVVNTSASGKGSFYDAVTCAMSGDTVRFSPHIKDVEINMGSLNIVLNKTLHIESSLSKNIHISSTNNGATIVNLSPITGNYLKMKGMHIRSANANIGAINNFGILTLENVNVYKWNAASTATIQNFGLSANLIIFGQCGILNL